MSKGENLWDIFRNTGKDLKDFTFNLYSEQKETIPQEIIDGIPDPNLLQEVIDTTNEAQLIPFLQIAKKDAIRAKERLKQIK